LALPARLIEQARHLAHRDSSGRPRQDHLRRAISTAYYALFHFLIDQGCRAFIGSANESIALRGVLARAFDHSAMRKASSSFAAGALPRKLAPALAGSAVPPNLRLIAESFQTLQQKRHEADYDALIRFNRADTLGLIDLSEEAMTLWPSVAATRAGRLYLVALLAGERIRE
jgi:hypothetical protein